MNSSTADRNPKFSPMVVPQPKLQMSVSADPLDINLNDIMLNTIVTQTLISDGIISSRDEDSTKSFEEKCAKYLGLNEDEIEKMKELLKGDFENVDD